MVRFTGKKLGIRTNATVGNNARHYAWIECGFKEEWFDWVYLEDEEPVLWKWVKKINGFVSFKQYGIDFETKNSLREK